MTASSRDVNCNAPTLLIRANATPRTGAGHVMRMASFVERWLEGGGGQVSVAGEIDIPFVRERLSQLNLPQASRNADILIVDSYDPGVRAEGARSSDHKLRVLVDDLGGNVDSGYDVVWNPNAYDPGGLYPSFGGEVVGGRDSVPIRPGLPRWNPSDDKQIGVTLGGGAPEPALLDALQHLSQRHPEHHFVSPSSWAPTGWGSASPTDLWSQLHRVTSLVTAAGSTVWEAAAVGVPVIVIIIADNQQLVANWVGSCGAPVVDARSQNRLAERLDAALERARALRPVDGRARAIVERLLSAAQRTAA